MGKVIAALAAAVALSGCASIVKGSGPQLLAIRSQPPGADVKIVDVATNVVVAKGRTPFMAMLKASSGFFQKAKYRVVLELAGHQPTEALVDPTVSGWYVAGNLVFGGLIGWLIVDPATGAMWTLPQEAIDVQLAPVSPAGTPPAIAPTASLAAPHVGVMTLGDVPPAARARMIALR